MTQHNAHSLQFAQATNWVQTPMFLPRYILFQFLAQYLIRDFKICVEFLEICVSILKQLKLGVAKT